MAETTPASDEKPTTPVQAETTPEKLRFEVELEFLQCLASPVYLNFLAQNEYFDDPDFLAYLKYLLYWKKPEYAKFIVFPHALTFLHLLQEVPFRENLKRSDFSILLHQQQGWQWQFSKSMRLRSETMNASNAGEKGDGQPQTVQPTEPGLNAGDATPSAVAGKPIVVDAHAGAPPPTGVQGAMA